MENLFLFVLNDLLMAHNIIMECMLINLELDELFFLVVISYLLIIYMLKRIFAYQHHELILVASLLIISLSLVLISPTFRARILLLGYRIYLVKWIIVVLRYRQVMELVSSSLPKSQHIIATKQVGSLFIIKKIHVAKFSNSS